ncbi:MAG: nadD [Micavibrio sp.]|nr:nadD [Micavibrio sp.]
MKTIALFGGSFNPVHQGHFETAANVHQALGVDEVWFMFSLNRLKDVADYAPLHHRMAMADIMAKHYPGKPFIMSGIEDLLGTHRTCDVLAGIRAQYPDDKFIWTMGADNLENFHLWENYDQIINTCPIAILDRPGYTDKARNGITAKTYPHLEVTDAKNLVSVGKGWCFLNNPPVDMSSSNLLTRMRGGERQFPGAIQEIVDYILLHGLYNIDQSPGQRPGPLTPRP